MKFIKDFRYPLGITLSLIAILFVFQNGTCASLTLPQVNDSLSKVNSIASTSGNSPSTPLSNTTPTPSSVLAYSWFHSITEYASLEDAIAHTSYIALPQAQSYVIDNPITIDQTQPLYIHGLDRISTQLTPKNPNAPLFIVKNVPLLNIAGLTFAVPNSVLNYIPISFQNTSPIQYESQDVFNGGTQFTIEGPGTFRFQGSTFDTCNVVAAGLLVNHPNADVVVVGGNAHGCGGTLKVPEFHHLWQKAGRLRVFDFGFQGNPGAGDIKIETGSDLGYHQIAYVRSEGGPLNGIIPSEILTVPPSPTHMDTHWTIVPDTRVNVLMVAASLRDGLAADVPINTFADYNGSGNLFLISNSAALSANAIVNGNAPGATIVAMGNYNASDVNPFPINPINVNVVTPIPQAKASQMSYLVFASNMYYYRQEYGGSVDPALRNLTLGTGAFNNLSAINMILAVPPKLEIPMPLSRPLMDVPFPGMTNVKSLGAVGDGVTDDTAAIQSALTKSRYVYFPAGTYLTSSTLQYTYKSAGGYIGGAGAGQTIIQRNFSQNGGVFGTQGFGYTTIQGITFQTAPYNASASPATTALNFDIEFTPGTGFASQENMFYDCVFDGGLHALAVGNSSTAMNSENMYNNCTFKNAYRGVAIGNYNALNNLVYNGTFDHDYIAISNSGTPNSGGSYSVFYGKATNIGYSTLEFLNSVDSTFAFYQLQSDAPNVFFNGYTTARFSMYFDQCTFTENAPPPSGWAIWTNSAMAVAFANSTMQGKVGLRGGAAAETFIKINSTINYSSGAPEYSGSAEATFPTINSAPGAPLPH